MHKKILSLLAVTCLSGCAYAVDTSVQDITIITPGAEDAVCMMYVDGVRYRVHPPQKTSTFRSKEDLVIDCLAPGNRRKKVVIEPGYADSAAGNVLTAGAGLAWDYASGALFKYPDIVEVSFVDTPIGPAFTPAQNNPDIRQPEDYPLEEFKASQPVMNEDRSKEPTEYLRTGSETFDSGSQNSAESFYEDSAAAMSGKGNLQSVTDSYGDALNPSGAMGAPTPLIPGE